MIGQVADQSTAPQSASSLSSSQAPPLQIPAAIEPGDTLDTVARERLLKKFGYRFFRGSRPVLEQQGVTVREDYPLGPGDVLNIELWGDMNEQFSLEISEDGFIDVPNVGRIYLHGVAFGRAGKLIVDRLGTVYFSINQEFPLQGTTKVSVSLARTSGIWVTVVGEVRNAGNLYIRNTQATLLNCIILCGGPTENASFRKINIRRAGGENIAVDLYKLFLEGSLPPESSYLKDGDILFIPISREEAEIKGAVRRPGIYELRETDTMEELINMGGGLLPNAKLDNIQLERNTGGIDVQVFDYDLSGSNHSEIRSIQLSDGDVLYVREKSVSRMRNEVYISGEGVRVPGRYQMQAGMTVKNLVERAGLFQDAYTKQADLIRRQSDYSSRSVQVDLDKVLRGESNITLSPMDSLIVYSKEMIEGGDKTIILEGHVKNPGEHILREGLTLRDLLFYNGGFSDPEFLNATYLARADLIRVDEETQREFVSPFSLIDLVTRRAVQDIELRTGDRIRVYGRSELVPTESVTIQGAVRRPGRYELKKDMDVRDLIMQASGLREFADSSRIEISRKINHTNPANKSEIKTIICDLKDGISAPQKLGPDDFVIVRELPIARKQKAVQIAGEVGVPGAYVIQAENERIIDLINRAGGVSSTGFMEAATLYRKQDSIGTVNIDLKRAIDNPKSMENLILMDGDSLTVPQKNLIVTVSGEVFRPGSIPFIPGEKHGYYIRLAGGLTARADGGNIRIILPNGRVNRPRSLWFDSEVPAGSEIIVPAKPEPPPREERTQ